MKKIFFPHRILDTLADEGKLTINQNIMTVHVKDRPSFELEPACRILRTSDGGPDSHDIVGTVKTEKMLREMGAEVYLDSVLYRDVAYQAEPGFIGEEKELMDKLADTELLARYLLENLL